VNQITSYLDGSAIYGSTPEEQHDLRLLEKGMAAHAQTFSWFITQDFTVLQASSAIRTCIFGSRCCRRSAPSRQLRPAAYQRQICIVSRYSQPSQKSFSLTALLQHLNMCKKNGAERTKKHVQNLVTQYHSRQEMTG
jgi:hypothetical protein